MANNNFYVCQKKVLQWQVQDPIFTIIRLLLHLHVYIISPKYHISKSSKHHNQNFEKISLVIEFVNHFVSQCKYFITPEVSPKSTSSCSEHHSLMLLSSPLKVSIFLKIHFSQHSHSWVLLPYTTFPKYL